jgi:hypothetical protein
MPELKDLPDLHALLPVVTRTLLSTLETLLSGHQTSNTNNSATQQGNVLALLGILFQQARAVNTPLSTSPKTPSPLDDLENVAGITVDDENAEINMNEDPLVTLKQRLPGLDANLRDALETLGQEMQEITLEVETRKKSYANFVVPFGAKPYIARYIMIKNDLKILDASKDDPEYNQEKADLDTEIKQYKIKGSGCGCYQKATQAGVYCAVRARIKCFVRLVTQLARYMAKSLCQGNSMIRRDHWNVPVERRTMACIIALLDQEHKTNTKFFDDYLGTSRDVVAEAFLAEYKETPPFQ